VGLTQQAKTLCCFYPVGLHLRKNGIPRAGQAYAGLQHSLPSESSAWEEDLTTAVHTLQPSSVLSADSLTVIPSMVRSTGRGYASPVWGLPLPISRLQSPHPSELQAQTWHRYTCAGFCSPRADPWLYVCCFPTTISHMHDCFWQESETQTSQSSASPAQPADDAHV